MGAQQGRIHAGMTPTIRPSLTSRQGLDGLLVDRLN